MPDGRVRERCSAASENQKLDNYLDFFLIFLNCDRSQLGAYIEYPVVPSHHFQSEGLHEAEKLLKDPAFAAQNMNS